MKVEYTKLQLCRDPNALAEAGVRRFIAAAEAAVERRGVFLVALAGGSTPRGLYARLAAPEFAGYVDWSKTHVFWGDERCVPPNHPDSNFRLASHSLLEHVSIPSANIHRMHGELPPETATAEYEAELAGFFGSASAPTSGFTFDLTLLGMGEDGHTASLFPGSPALQIRDHWVAAVPHTSPPEPLVDRLTLTLPALNASRSVLFLVSGEQKAAALRQTMMPADAASPKPAALIRPAQGDLLWLVDQAAASQLTIA
ncbi:MAG: 6-phosphogluconolactonase [Anaerolineae bacterium UTCFX2]|jgi:6-phosphogluconolactonase|nr:6-phosphogluconolactonase [Anaerolineae bacterium]MCZ7552143.1 6-phosphogluconolactonase [Anaerolineales bacterium]OQY93017.1 MAG: 6-phosphogluconolactonase [Anaerolineae bacterium UTCFX2]